MPDIHSLSQPVNARLSSDRLPLIDISPYLNPSSTVKERRATAHAVDKACREYGFFHVTGHGLDLAYLQSLLALGHQFFDLPDERKDLIHISKSQDGVRGFQRIRENVTSAKRDHQEAIDFYPEPEYASNKQLEGSQPWPEEDDLPGFKRIMLDYTEKMRVIGHAFMRAMGDALGEQAVFATLQQDNYWAMRVIGYPPLSADVDTDQGISCGAHTDYGCLTFLLADDCPGALQVEAKDGSWIPADPAPGGFAVNIGDILDVMTSHQYKSTYHRVIHRGNKHRVSIPFFFEPPRDMTIVPIPSMIPEGASPVEPVVYFDHLKTMIYRNFVPIDEAIPSPKENPLSKRGK